nr:GNAT family N-acetyltransferase [Pelomonas sp. P8]
MNELFTASWPGHRPRDFKAILSYSMAYVCAYRRTKLIGFVNVAWDGKTHAFILDTTVHPEQRRQGIGKELVNQATRQARLRGVAWVHVDYEPHLKPFYAECGFRASEAGVLNVAGEA